MSVDFHFLNVGYGDCTIVHWPERTCGDITKPERTMMMDIYHHKDHPDYTDAIEYYKANFKRPDGSIMPIFRFVCSHPHQDHICGMKKLFESSDIEIVNFWDLDHSFVPSDFDGHPTHEEDWDAYKKFGSKSSPFNVLRISRETTPAQFWDNAGDRITILSPSTTLTRYAHYKDDGTKRDPDTVEIDEMSYALAIRVNSRSVILAGDGRASPTWDDIFANCQDALRSCWVLKAGHHGHECSFHEDAVKLMNPVVIVFSNSKEENRANGAEAKYEKACPNAYIYKTWEGNVVVRVPFDASKQIEVRRV